MLPSAVIITTVVSNCISSMILLPCNGELVIFGISLSHTFFADTTISSLSFTYK